MKAPPSGVTHAMIWAATYGAVMAAGYIQFAPSGELKGQERELSREARIAADIAVSEFEAILSETLAPMGPE